ncbi:pantetheine-phosphate adenylyltransferase [Miniphocaeibacter massiliensis]|uniref:pantetheine-phosphate adenylyltransferase n=1 Tax=Miniphocaeibacter massiliensis TaxID=2041841 RepID=UPI000C07CB6E|nr:pantetheine-phosphate adenylyltransferase [Miniphocaeibacter massiliensis]
MKIIYPGSFDPITYGHLDIIERISKKFNKVYVAILNNKNKNSLFTIEERKKIILDSCKHLNNVEVVSFSGLLADFAKELDCNLIARGLREVSDYEKEVQMALMNKELYSDLETLFLVSNYKYSFLSSSLVKEIISFGGDIDKFVSPMAVQMMKEKYSE